MLSNIMPAKIWDEITYPSANFHHKGLVMRNFDVIFFKEHTVEQTMKLSMTHLTPMWRHCNDNGIQNAL